jgi:hypothetical protein
VVEVRESYGGEVFIWYKGQAIKLRKLECPVRQVEIGKVENKRKVVPNRGKAHKPPSDHLCMDIKNNQNRYNDRINNDNLNTVITGRYYNLILQFTYKHL